MNAWEHFQYDLVQGGDLTSRYVVTSAVIAVWAEKNGLESRPGWFKHHVNWYRPGSAELHAVFIQTRGILLAASSDGVCDLAKDDVIKWLEALHV